MDYWPLIGAVFVAAVMLFFLVAFRRDGREYYIRPMKKDAWGTRFEIVAPNGEVVGFDWYTVAKQRCAALNQGHIEP